MPLPSPKQERAQAKILGRVKKTQLLLRGTSNTRALSPSPQLSQAPRQPEHLCLTGEELGFRALDTQHSQKKGNQVYF